jgi:hypothetical protein
LCINALLVDVDSLLNLLPETTIEDEQHEHGADAAGDQVHDAPHEGPSEDSAVDNEKSVESGPRSDAATRRMGRVRAAPDFYDPTAYGHVGMAGERLSDDPQSYTEVMGRWDKSLWEQSMNEELTSLLESVHITCRYGCHTIRAFLQA